MNVSEVKYLQAVSESKRRRKRNMEAAPSQRYPVKAVLSGDGMRLRVGLGEPA